jgi:gliding motility-associated-like protein
MLTWMHTSETSETIDSLNAGTYKFTVTDQCGTYTDSIVLTNPDSIIISGNITNETVTDLKDGSISITVNGGTSPYYFNWSNATNEQDLYNIGAGSYTISILDFNKCPASAMFTLSTDVETIEPVDAFTPNGDGVNETWNINNIDKFPSCTVKIFNQWGNLVYESTGYDEPWDGTNNGKQMSSSVYYYIIDLKNGENPVTGSITLLR